MGDNIYNKRPVRRKERIDETGNVNSLWPCGVLSHELTRISKRNSETKTRKVISWLHHRIKKISGSADFVFFSLAGLWILRRERGIFDIVPRKLDGFDPLG